MKQDLDYILLEQYHSCRRRLKNIKRLRKILKNEPGLDILQEECVKKINFFETYISDKNKLKRKVKIKKSKCYFGRNPIYDMYRTSYIISMFYFQNYMSILKKVIGK